MYQIEYDGRILGNLVFRDFSRAVEVMREMVDRVTVLFADGDAATRENGASLIRLRIEVQLKFRIVEYKQAWVEIQRRARFDRAPRRLAKLSRVHRRYVDVE